MIDLILSIADLPITTILLTLTASVGMTWAIVRMLDTKHDVLTCKCWDCYQECFDAYVDRKAQAQGMYDG